MRRPLAQHVSRADSDVMDVGRTGTRPRTPVHLRGGALARAAALLETGSVVGWRLGETVPSGVRYTPSDFVIRLRAASPPFLPTQSVTEERRARA